AFADDGTMFFSSVDGTDGWIGKVAGGVVTERWLKMDRYTTGIAIDHARKQLYVASLSRSAVLAYDLTAASPVATTLVTEAYGINDLAVDPAGTVHYTAQGPRMVYRAVNGKGVAVTTSIIGNLSQDLAPAGLAFGPDGSLFVGMRSEGPILRLTLVNGVESARSEFGIFRGWANGLAFDSAGRLYVATYKLAPPSSLVRITATGDAVVQLAVANGFASLAFGRGPLDCNQLYVANPAGAMVRLTTDTPGLRLP
ncbi:MAG TPA: SMP-30/gluconolactonase/LRE family protein, partial [Polyangia bacterium]